jgi:hypothetical protein
MLQKWEYSRILALWRYSIWVLIGLIGLWMLSIAGLSCCPAPSQPRPGRDRVDRRAGKRAGEPGP